MFTYLSVSIAQAAKFSGIVIVVLTETVAGRTVVDEMCDICGKGFDLGLRKEFIVWKTLH